MGVAFLFGGKEWGKRGRSSVFVNATEMHNSGFQGAEELGKDGRERAGEGVRQVLLLRNAAVPWPSSSKSV